MTDAAVRPIPTPRLRLRSPGDLVTAVPYLLGFHPSESLVLVAVRGARRRVTCTLRWDLPPLRGRRDRERAVIEVRSRLGQVKADAAILVLYTDRAARADALPLADLVAAVEAAGVGLLEALCVRTGRWWSYLCTNPRCCPPEGTALPASTDAGAATEIAAAAALAGLAALPTREDLVAALRPIGTAAVRAVEEAMGREASELAARATRGATVEDLRAESVRLFRAPLRRYADPPARLEPDETARLLLGVLDVRVRDEVMLWSPGPDDDALRALLTDLVRAAPRDAVPAPATMLAWVAYQQGDGAFARIALDRAFAADPGYRLALLLETALSHGVHPAAFLQSGAPAR